jgi:hypothetical protein
VIVTAGGEVNLRRSAEEGDNAGHARRGNVARLAAALGVGENELGLEGPMFCCAHVGPGNQCCQFQKLPNFLADK